jgi:crotonobetainyl-CoA:carnitine CoA-transferase CaiB-like acyl-CoA transferase
MENHPGNTILSGYRIIDLTDKKGMLGTRLLADMGAEVIRIEKPENELVINTPEFCYLNSGKRSISLDFEKEKGHEIFKRLVATADVVVETEKPGYMASLELGYPDLSGINPGLVMASLTDFGQTGPYRDLKSCDLVAGALGGWFSVCGEPEAPLKPCGNQTYNTASLFLANGIMLALWQRHATGKGQYIDISVMECVAATLDHVLVRYFYEGKVAGRNGNRHWNNAFRIFPCRDGYILLSILQHWETLVEWLDSEGMAGDLTDEKWKDRQVRIDGIEYIIDILENWTLSHNVADLVEKGQLMRFPWAEVASIADVLRNPHFVERGFFTEVEYDNTGERYKSAGAPVKMSRAPWRTGGRVPQSGRDNQDIYRRVLGLSLEELEILDRETVI